MIPNWNIGINGTSALDLSKLNTNELTQLKAALTPKLSRYIPHTPTPKQAAFLLLSCREAFFGGAAGGGKSDALLMAALQYVDIPNYSAILFRKSYADLTLPGALMDRAAQWLGAFVDEGTVKWNDKLKTYTFYTDLTCSINSRRKNIADTSTLAFGFLDNQNDKYKYQGAEFQFVGVDETTQIAENNYRYLFSRLRRLLGVPIPIRMRGASNPGGEGHEWVKRRFIIEGRPARRIFIPAKMDDNPFLDIAEYNESLNELDPITRAQLRNGDWEVKTEGSMFHREWFEIISARDVPKSIRLVRFWDLAATKQHKKNKDPDWTVGLALGEYKGQYYLIDIRRDRKRPAEVEQMVQRAAFFDGSRTVIGMEQEPGSSGVIVSDHYARNVLRGFTYKPMRSTGNKILRATPVSCASENRLIKVVQGSWNGAFFDEIESFPNGDHDDQVDALSGAFEMLKSKLVAYYPPIEVGGECESIWNEGYEGDYESAYSF